MFSHSICCTSSDGVPPFESGANSRLVMRSVHFLFLFLFLFLVVYSSVVLISNLERLSVKMDGGRSIKDQCAFEMLFTRSVPHILEKIFCSLDYALELLTIPPWCRHMSMILAFSLIAIPVPTQCANVPIPLHVPTQMLMPAQV